MTHAVLGGLGRFGRWGVLLVFFVAAWLVIGGLPATELAVVVLALYYSAAGYSFNLLYGGLGIFSMAQPVFVAVGGYTSVYLYSEHGTSPWLSIPIAMVIAGVISLPVALVAMRRTGTVITALVTLIVSQAAPPVLSSIDALGGSIGLYLNVKPEDDWGAMQFADAAVFGRILLVVNVVIIAALMWFGRSRIGRWVQAVKDSQQAAAAVGIPVRSVRIAMFVASAMIAAVPGVVFAQYNLLVNATLFLGTSALFQVIVAALIGGSARPWGTLVGALVIVTISHYLTEAFDGRPGVGPLTFAAVFLVMALVMPTGISGTWAKLIARRSSGPVRADRAEGLPGAGPDVAGGERPDRSAASHART
jgi:branched-chain amino acid transport system permease protein